MTNVKEIEEGDRIEVEGKIYSVRKTLSDLRTTQHAPIIAERDSLGELMNYVDEMTGNHVVIHNSDVPFMDIRGDGGKKPSLGKGFYTKVDQFGFEVVGTKIKEGDALRIKLDAQ